MLASAMDGVPAVTDQMALTDCAKERLMPLTVLDDCQCKYRSGFYFQDPFYQGRCRLRPVVQQHKWMVGAQTKIVSVPAGCGPAGRISCPLWNGHKRDREESVVGKSLIVLLNCFCFLMIDFAKHRGM